ncbi:MAG TPA: phage tail sheath C-terminal domain-containing protein [Clostridia bacterium]|nr:phage tail sheath C-terminal domain-containing protein [Clostridia bacterium]
MGLPKITITFTAAAEAVSRRAGQGTVALILRDAAAQGVHEIGAADDIPAALGAENKAYIAQALIGNVNRPGKVIACVVAVAAGIVDALAILALYDFDWLAGPPDLSAEDAAAVKSWVRTQRDDYNRIYKAVLPNLVADDEAVVNFTAADIAVGEAEYATAGYCARIAGLIAGTPLSQSVTYAVLEEVSDVERLSKAALDAAVEAGKLVLVHDSTKVKVGRGVTSLTTVAGKSKQLQKIKLVETLDLIQRDLRMLTQDNYIGKMANSYDNKVVLMSAYMAYFKELEAEGVLQAGRSRVEIDIAAQRQYLKDRGDNVLGMTDMQIKTADTDEHVFTKGSIRMLDAIEDVDLDIDF